MGEEVNERERTRVDERERGGRCDDLSSNSTKTEKGEPTTHINRIEKGPVHIRGRRGPSLSLARMPDWTPV
jgi:hypothetical protein